MLPYTNANAPDSRPVPATGTPLEQELRVIDDLERRGVMGSEIAAEQRTYYRKKAAAAQSGALPAPAPYPATNTNAGPAPRPGITSTEPAPASVSPDNPLPANPAVTNTPSGPGTPLAPQRPPHTEEDNGFWETLASFFTFANLIWVAASALLIIAIMWLAGVYLVALLLLVPVLVWEALMYGICLSLMMYATNWSHEWAGLVALPGCMGLLPAAMFSHWRHKEKLSVYFQQHDIHRIAFTSGWLGAMWGTAAAVHQSAMLGSMSGVAAVVAFLASNRIRNASRELAPLGGWTRPEAGLLLTKVLMAGFGCYILMPLLFTLEKQHLVFLPAAYMGVMLGWIIPALQLSAPRVAPLVRAEPVRWRVVAVISGSGALAFGYFAGYDLALRTGATMLLVFALLQIGDALARRKDKDPWTALAYSGAFFVAALLLGFYPDAWLTYGLTPGVQLQLKFLTYLLFGGGLLYLSTRIYSGGSTRCFFYMQLLFIICVAILAFAPTALAPHLAYIFPTDVASQALAEEPWYLYDTRKLSGSLLAVYLLVKFIDLPSAPRAWPWVALSLAAMLYGLSLIARAHPSYFWLSGTAGT